MGRNIAHAVVRNNAAIQVVAIRSVDTFPETLTTAIGVGCQATRTHTFVFAPISVGIHRQQPEWASEVFGATTHL